MDSNSLNKAYIDHDSFLLDELTLDYIYSNPAMRNNYLATLGTKLLDVEKKLNGDVSIDKKNAFLVITILRQQREAIIRAIDQLKEKENQS